MIRKTPLEEWIRGRLFPDDAVLTRERLDNYQLESLRRNISYVKQNSRFYRELYRSLDPSDLALPEDLRKIPFTVPDDVRSSCMQMVCVRQGDISRIVTLNTSGTTGNPKRIFFTEEDQELTIDFFQHGMSTFTGNGDRVLVLLPGERPGSIGDLLKTALGRIPAEAPGIRGC